ncbi:two-component regulator propeller domain-containing protein [Pedobacter sp. Leaf132]|uniref:ligand-binding sensor domain-containing protein n=1 Tax=Pedobacter sp. Leaf132 TaxID=2876557 RepID=UPI001E63357C|nr:two-component regulator propeller domain-containing protein [Pedobacter sp. Leaf132]
MQSKSLIVKFIVIFLFISSKLLAQSYNFTRYGLKEGLPQSQVSVIYQAKNRTLWLGTFGGVSNFDGKFFTSYSKADGLISNSITSIVEDDNEQVYIGTELGLNIISKGKIETVLPNSFISQLKKDKQGKIWGLSNRKLFHIDAGKPVFSEIKDEKITCLSVNVSGDLYAFIWEKGIFKRDTKTWKLFKAFPAEIASTYVSKILFDDKNPNKLFVLSNKLGVYSLEKGAINRVFYNENQSNYYTIAQDTKGGLWVGTDKGVYLLNKNRPDIHFNDTNGLSDNRVYDIFKDKEGNIWVSCFSDGLYKYEGDAYIRYLAFKGQSLNFPISGVAADKSDNLWIGSTNKGLLKYNGTTIERVANPEFRDKNILFTYTDKAKNVWISVADKGIWKYNGNKFTKEVNAANSDFNSMLQDKEGGYWFNNLMETLYIKDGKTQKISGFEGNSSCIYQLNSDSILLGTSAGIQLIKNKKLDKSFRIKELNGIYILSITKHKGNILFGTLGDGMLAWNLKTKKIKKYTVNSGLNSNDIYSMAADSNNYLWIGTGRGINTLNLNKKNNNYEILENSPLIIECNQSVILNYKNSMVIGTVMVLFGVKHFVILKRKSDHLLTSIS